MYMDSLKNLMVQASDINLVSLHSADPGTTGTNELSGGSYAKETITFAAASGGEKAVNNAPVVNVPASATVAWVGLWAGATFRAKKQVTTETYSENGGTYQVQNTSKLTLEDVV